MLVTIIIIIVLSLPWLLWRLLSRRYILPCPTWLGWMVEMDNPFTKVNRANNIIEHLQLRPGMSILDIGCGPGRVTIPLAKKIIENGDVVAMDIQEGMLKRTRDKAQNENLTNIHFLHAAIGENKLPHDKFDRILLVTVLGEIPKQEEALKEIYLALKPNGILSITELIFDPHFQRKSYVMNLASKIGFVEKDFFGNSIAYTLHLEKSGSIK